MIKPTYTFDQFLCALRRVETGGAANRGEFAVGDYREGIGQSIGPFQIQRGCHADSGVQFDYEACNRYLPSVTVMIGYFLRHCPSAGVFPPGLDYVRPHMERRTTGAQKGRHDDLCGARHERIETAYAGYD